MIDLLKMFGNPYDKPAKKVLRPPFGYPGGKIKSVKNIVPILTNIDHKVYVEVFGGSAAVLINKPKVKMEVYNDRYSGVVAFYKCIRDPKKLFQFCEKVELSIMSKEDWYDFHATWHDCADDVERAFRWYYMLSYSFGGMSRNWGHGKATTGAGKIRDKIPLFWQVHQRFEKVQIDNADWRDCIHMYDSPDTLFYLDPPYIEADNRACYAHSEINYDDLMGVIRNCQGKVALSGYDNPIFEWDGWHDKEQWDNYISIQSIKHDTQNRGNEKETLWIKL